MKSKLNINEASSNTILLDYDDMSARNVIRTFRKPWQCLSRTWSLQATGVQVWRTSHENWHVEIYLTQAIPDLFLVFLQIALGSDYKLEILNFMRIVQSDEPCNNLYFEKWHVAANGENVLLSREKPARSLTKALERIVLGK